MTRFTIVKAPSHTGSKFLLVDLGSKQPETVATFTDDQRAWAVAAILNDGDLGDYDSIEPF